MTVIGTVYRASFLLLCLVATVASIWVRLRNMTHQDLMTYRRGMVVIASLCSLGGLALAWITMKNKRLSAVTGPLYTLLEGIVIGVLSVAWEVRYPGIAVKATGLTFAVFLISLVVYRAGFVHVTDEFNAGLLAATSGVAFYYLLGLTLNIVRVPVPRIWAGGIPGILISGAIVLLAALNLVADFNFIERCADSGFPKYMEWYAAFGLIVTLIWFYLEIFRLLAKARRAQDEGAA